MQNALHVTTLTESRGARYRRLLARFAAASIVATVLSQLVFLTSYSLGALPVVATVLAWLAGAIPNFVLNRRTWGSSGRTALRGELGRFAIVSVGTALLAATATSCAEPLARTAFPDTRPFQVAVVWSAFLGTYLLMFVVKFFLFDRLVFKGGRTHLPQQSR